MRDLKLIGSDLYTNIHGLDGCRVLIWSLAFASNKDTAAALEVFETSIEKLSDNIAALASEIGGQKDV